MMLSLGSICTDLMKPTILGIICFALSLWMTSRTATKVAQLLRAEIQSNPNLETRIKGNMLRDLKYTALIFGTAMMFMIFSPFISLGEHSTLSVGMKTAVFLLPIAIIFGFQIRRAYRQTDSVKIRKTVLQGYAIALFAWGSHIVSGLIAEEDWKSEYDSATGFSEKTGISPHEIRLPRH